MTPSGHHNRHSPAAFTLIEVMVATAISGMLLVVLASMLTGSLNAYAGAQRDRSPTLETRAGMDLIRADLRSYRALPEDTSSNLTTTPLPRFVYKAAADTLGSDRIAFLRASRTRTDTAFSADAGNLILVAYTAGFTADFNGSSSQKLYRRAFSAQETFYLLQRAIQSNQPLLTETDWQTIEQGLGGAEPVVYQLIQFRAKPLAAVIEQQNDPGSITSLIAPTLPEWPVDDRPAAIDIRLRVATQAIASRLKSRDDWQARGNFTRQLLGPKITPDDFTDDVDVETRQQRINLGAF
ncbi:MAG: prepilin-type N-terminal cleavage/methylation domain-containing protein [Verrucomicrobiaceae bacterium]|nr:prepilin-type N-terminal cleavage/methylation domain-containing protein [Verrucomicrobiaceae bacterium]